MVFSRSLLVLTFCMLGALPALALECKQTTADGSAARCATEQDKKTAAEASEAVSTPAAAAHKTEAAKEEPREHAHDRDAHHDRRCGGLPCPEIRQGDKIVIVPVIIEQKTVVVQPPPPPLTYAPQKLTRDGVSRMNIDYPQFNGGDVATILNSWVAQNIVSCNGGKGGTVEQSMYVRSFGGAVLLHDEGSAECDPPARSADWSRDLFFDASNGQIIDLEMNLSAEGRAYIEQKIAAVAMHLPPGDVCREMYLSEAPLAYNFYIRDDGRMGINPAYARGDDACDATETIALPVADLRDYYPVQSTATLVFDMLRR